MDNFAQARIRRIAFSLNHAKNDFRNLPHETVAEFLARGGKITKCPSNFMPITKRWAQPTNLMTNVGQTIYDWRV